MAKIMNLYADNAEELCAVGKALASPIRIQILKYLYYNSFNVKEIASALGIPTSSAALHVRLLEEANLIQTKQTPGRRGSMKICSRKNDYINIRLSGDDPGTKQVSTISMPVGEFTDCCVRPSCGLVNALGPIGSEDRPSDFYLPGRMEAQLLWSASGYVEYKFPFPTSYPVHPKMLRLSLEICSEAPNYKDDWRSDITFWINDLECGMWSSPGDFGSRRGRLNPSWWDNGVSQYGKLTILEVSESGTYINSEKVSEVSIADLQLNHDHPVTIRIGNKDDATFVGGFNIFGSKFGDYEQDILLSFVY